MGETVDLRGADPPRAGALVLATMAYPGEGELGLRELTSRKLFNRWLRQVIASRPDVAQQPITVRPIELMMDLREVRGGRRRLENRLRARLTAGLIALPFILQQEGKTPPPAFLKRPTRMMAARMVLGEGSTVRVKHLLNRQFYPTLPVVHLAAAWAAMVTRDGVAGADGTAVDDLLVRPELLAELLTSSEQLVPVLQASKLAMDPDSLIRFIC